MQVFCTSRSKARNPGIESRSGPQSRFCSVPAKPNPCRRTPSGQFLSNDTGAAKTQGGQPPISPRARRLAERYGFVWTDLKGSGRTGRIRERDVAGALSSRPPQGISNEEKVIPLTPIRRTIAARMVESRRETAPVTLTSTADATDLVKSREQFKTLARTDGGPIPTYTDFLLKLVAAALLEHPLLAARWTDAGLRLARRIDIGLAVDTEAGLLVPVVRDVPALELRQLAERTLELIDLARQGRLMSREMDGGCFTITNLGSYGIETFTPIINLPECAILGVGRIERQPVMDGDRVVGRDRMPLSLTFDHRIVDGAPASRFLQTLVRLIENPGPWLAT
jgi:pyruvate dehydrogenase E2 component (dihydrolipoamide acetyltransferase)